ncbi:MAG: hypothetical protein HY984_01205 [Candidatus Magasanikbacteria bacterium]|nr:hypothetical protein [Candidatus Magasanikbacteria bacterium]
MNNVLTYGKKAFTWSVVVLTILWSMGVAALVPLMAQAVAPNLQPGDLFRVEGDRNRSVYSVGPDMKRHCFPSADVFMTWYKDFSGVQVIQPQYVDAYPTGSCVMPRPGSMYLVKTTVSPSVFAILPGNKKTKLVDPTVAAALFGPNWGNLVHDWADIVDTQLTLVDATTEAKFIDGQLIKVTGSNDVYQVMGGKLKKVDGALPDVARNDVRSVANLNGYTMDTATVTGGSLVSNPSQVGSGSSSGSGSSTSTAAGTLTVSLAANTAGAGYVARGADNVEFAKFTFRAMGGSVKVTKVVLKQDGFIGSTNDLGSFRLWDGAKQLGSDQTPNTNTKLAAFSGLNWTLNDGESKTLTVGVDTVSGGNGTNGFVVLNSVEVMGGGVVAGAPVNGNTMQYHSASVGQLNLTADTSPGATTLISGSTDQQLFCFRLNTNSTEGFSVKSIKLTNNGTISANELMNFRLRDGATLVAQVDGALQSDNTLTFDLTSSPYWIDKSKTKTLCTSADIKGGITVSKTVILQVVDYKDVAAVGDTSKGQVRITTGSGSTYSTQTAQTMTVGQGTLTVARNTATLPVSTSLIDGVAHNKVAAYRFSAGSTEGARVTRLRLTVSNSSDIGSADFSNFQLYKYDEVTGTEAPLGSSQGISGSTVTFEDTDAGLFDVAAGKNAVIHVYADVSTAAAWTGTTFNVFIGSTNSNLIVRAKGLNSSEYIPAVSITLSSVDSQQSNVVLFSNGNAGTLSVSLDNTSPAAASVAKGTNDVDLAHYRLYATGEDATVTQLVVRGYNLAGTVSTASTTNEFINVRLYDISSSSTPVMLGNAVATPSSGVATFSFSLRVPRDQYRVLKVVADVPSNSNGAGLLHLDVPGAGSIDNDITVSGDYSGVTYSTTNSGLSSSDAATGRTMTLAAPTLTVSLGTTPIARSIVQNAQGETVATINLQAGQYEAIRVSSIKVSVDDAAALNSGSTANTNFSNMRLVSADGLTQYGTTLNLTDGTPDYVQFNGITNLIVPKGGTMQIYVKVNITGSTAGPWYFGIASASDVVATGVASSNSATVSGSGAGTAQSITSSATLTFTKDSSSPLTTLVAVGASNTGTEVPVLAVDADANFEDVNVETLNFYYTPVTGDAAQSAFADNGVKLYKKVNGGAEVLVGSTSFVSSTSPGNVFAATFNISNDSPLRLGKDDTNTLIVKVLYNGVNNGASAASSPFIQMGDGSTANASLVTARGLSSQTALTSSFINGGTALNIQSDQKVLYKSYPTFAFQNLSSSVLANQEMEIFKFRMSASGGGAVAWKQLAFDVTLTDRLGVNDTLTVGSFKFYRGTTDITASVLIQNSAGASIKSGGSSLGENSGAANTVYVTWPTTTQESIAAGTYNDYTIKATPAGYATDADNDTLNVRLANSQSTTELSQTNDPYYLTAAGTGALVNVMVLGGSSQTNTTSADLIWSDMSASGHSAATGTHGGGTASSSADWFNGYYVTDTPTNYATLTY